MLSANTSQPDRATDERLELSSWTQADFRPRWQHLAAGALRWSGALSVTERLAADHAISHFVRRKRRLRTNAGPRIVILCYHRVGVGGIPLYSEMLPRLFESQMRYLRRHYRLLSLAEACDELNSPDSSEPSVVVTFDDGYRDLYPQAFPILQRYNIPATIYLTAGAIETGQPAWYDRIFLALKHAPGPDLEVGLAEQKPHHFVLRDDAVRFRVALEIITSLRAMPDTQRQALCAALETRIQLPPDQLANRMLDWDQIRQMQQAGLFFGCHTMTHAAVSRLDQSGRERELVDSKRLIENRIGIEIRDFAYPFGKREDCGTEARQILSREGFRSAVTTSDGVNVYGVDPLQLFRMNAGDERSLAMFAVRLNWAFLRAEMQDVAEGSGHRNSSWYPEGTV